MSEEIEIPDTPSERMEKFREPYENKTVAVPHPEDPSWYDRRHNEKVAKEMSWSSPYDARYPQVRKQNKCFHYYVDYFRCVELLGEDYKKCKLFSNVYKTFCPSDWVEKWDDWRERGVFPARFDR